MTPDAEVAARICSLHEQAAGLAVVDVTDVRLDSCCVVASPDDSTPSESAFVPGVFDGSVGSPVPALVLPTAIPCRARPAPVPLPGSHVAKHLLLSVFLI